jgi:nucleoside phosphorylase
VVDAIFVPAGFEARAVGAALRRVRSKITLIAVHPNSDAAQEAAMRALNSRRIERALVMGVCGLLVPELRPGDAVIYADIRTADLEAIKTDPMLNERLRSLFPEAYRNAHGLTWPTVVTRPEEKSLLASRFGASAVDTETYGIVSTLALSRVACGVIRFGSDGLKDSLPDVNVAMRKDGSLDGAKLFIEMLKYPLGGAHLVLGGRSALARMGRAAMRIAKAP